MNQSLPIYCLHLPRATERKQSIIDKWIKPFNLDIRFFDAFDKKELEKNNFIYLYQPKIPILKIRRPLSLGEIACATSYCLMFEQLLKDNTQEVLIIEDDAQPLINDKSQIFDIIDSGKKEFPQAEVFILHKALSYWSWTQLPQDNKFNCTKETFSLLKTAPYGTVCVYYTNSAMKKAYDNLIKMQYPADHLWNDIFVQDQTIIYCNKPIAFHDENEITYVGNEYRGFKRPLP